MDDDLLIVGLGLAAALALGRGGDGCPPPGPPPAWSESRSSALWDTLDGVLDIVEQGLDPRVAAATVWDGQAELGWAASNAVRAAKGLAPLSYGTWVTLGTFWLLHRWPADPACMGLIPDDSMWSMDIPDLAAAIDDVIAGLGSPQGYAP